MNAYDLKLYRLPSGRVCVWLRCPACGTRGMIDDDQLRGRVSVECASPGCGFHETVDFLPHLSAEDRAEAEAKGVEP